MKLYQEDIEVQSDGEFKAKTATIVASAHAYSVLSKGLYSNPLRAIVRELSCNAWDAHIAAGTTDKPFEVCLPNALAPTFKVRDYGIGLTEDAIFDVFDYFRSTKQQSNAMTGCFGLGAKSPFAYTNKYTIVSFKDGVKYHYIYVKDEHGIPKLIKMADGPTDEHNGVEISFSVESDDFFSFHEEAKVALRPFKNRPVIKGLSPKEVESFFPSEREHVISGEGWYLRGDGGNYRPNGQPIAVMGNVEYPINSESNRYGEKQRKGFSKNAQKLLCMDLVIDFPIGSFEITPSRESIQWSEFSANNINDRFEEIYDEILTLVEKKVSGAPTYWEASLMAKELLENSQVSVLQLRPTWQGKELNKQIEVPKGFIVTRFNASHPRCDSMGKSKYPNAVQKYQQSRIQPYHTKFMFADYQGAVHRLESHIRHDVARDYHVTLIQTCTHVMRKATLPDAALAAGQKPKEYEALVLTYQPDMLPQLCDVLGIDVNRIENVSTIPNKTRTDYRKSRLAGSKARAFKFKPYERGQANDLYWDECDVDLSKPGVYVEINKWRLVAQLSNTTPRFNRCVEFKAVYESLQGLGIKFPDDALIGVKSSDLKKFQKASNWMTLDAFIQKEVLAQWNKSTDFQFAYRLLKRLENKARYIRILTDYVMNSRGTGSCKWSNRFHEMVKKLDAANKQTAVVHRFDGFQSIVPDDVRKALETKDPDVEVLVTDVTERYPLLLNLFDGRHHSYLNRTAIAEYTQLIDKEI